MFSSLIITLILLIFNGDGFIFPDSGMAKQHPMISLERFTFLQGLPHCQKDLGVFLNSPTNSLIEMKD